MKINKALIATSLTLVMGQAWAQQNPTTTTTNPATTTTVKVEEPSKVGISYANYMFSPSLGKANNKYEINHFIGVQYNFSPGWFFGGTLRPDSNFTAVEAGKTKAVSLADSYLRLGLPIFKNENSGTELKAQVRYYFPTSEKSANVWSRGGFNPRLYAKQEIVKPLTVQYVVVPIFYNYLPNGPELNGDGSAPLKFYIGHDLEFAYEISDFISTELGFELEVAHNTQGAIAAGDMFRVGPTFNFTPKASLSTYYYAPFTDTKLANAQFFGSFSYQFL